MAIDFKHDTIKRAIEFARIAHGEQKRKYTNDTYINHPISVAGIVAEYIDDIEAVAAAILHDVVEDTPVTIEEIEAGFGKRIASLVADVTDVSQPSDGNRAIRKEMDRRHLARASQTAKTIKLADLIDNTSSIVEHDPDFAKIYMQEKRELLPYLVGGNPDLWFKAQSIVNDYFKDEPCRA